MTDRRTRTILTAAVGVAGLAAVAMAAPQGLPTTTAPAAVAAPLAQDPGVGGFLSDNLSYHGTLLNDAPGVGARLVEVDGQKRFYVSTVNGLSVYDVTDPSLPLLIGDLALPHWENENVAVSDDGSTILMSEFTGTYMHVITATELPGGLLALTPTGFTPGPAGHIVTCVDAACDWVYGSEGSIIDLRDKASPEVVGNWATQHGLPTSGHNLEIDAQGNIWSDTTPFAVMRVEGEDADGDGEVDSSDADAYLHPVLIATGRQDPAAGTAYQHNHYRIGDEAYEPRVKPDMGLRDTDPAAYEAALADYNDPTIRPGELLYGNGETNFGPQCSAGSGPFATYRIKPGALEAYDRTGRASDDLIETVDVFRPINGSYDGDGSPAINALGCSGHWFKPNPSDEGLVAAGWYEHATRLLRVDQGTGEIGQVGYFQPVNGSASAAHWIDDEWIYVVDYLRGVDILHYDADAPIPSVEEFDASWLAGLDNELGTAFSVAARYQCNLGRLTRTD